MDQKKSDIYINILIYLYLVLPTLIFFIGWLKWYWAFPLGILVLVSCIQGFRESVRERCLLLSGSTEVKTMLIALILIALWVYISGVGGYFYQNKDHGLRNTIFRALVERDWPVTTADGSRGMIYYIGYWLPAACVGKVFGLEAGFAAQAVWAVMGIFIVYYLICVYRNKVDLLPIVFMVFFSGLDYVGTCIVRDPGVDLSLALHLEWWASDFQFSSFTTQLFWVFNQVIPAWVATCLILVQKNGKNLLFILSLIMLTSTFQFAGLIPIVVYLYIKYVIDDKHRWKEIFTLQNFIGVFVVGIVILLYLIGNISAGMMTPDSTETAASGFAAPLMLASGAAAQGVPPLGTAMQGVLISGMSIVRSPRKVLKLFVFYFLEFGVYWCFVYKYRKNDPMVWLIVCILLICPFIEVGSGDDFCMRASIPALFILMIFSMEAFERIRLDGRRYLFVVYCAVLLLGAITPFNEIHRGFQETFRKAADGESVRYPAAGVEDMLQMGNFSGVTQGNIFYEYLAK